MSVVKDAIEKKKKRKMRRRVRRIFAGLFLFLLGVFVGIHRRVIIAAVKGEELPTPPAEHCHIFCR